MLSIHQKTPLAGSDHPTPRASLVKVYYLLLLQSNDLLYLKDRYPQARTAPEALTEEQGKVVASQRCFAVIGEL